MFQNCIGRKNYEVVIWSGLDQPIGRLWLSIPRIKLKYVNAC